MLRLGLSNVRPYYESGRSHEAYEPLKVNHLQLCEGRKLTSKTAVVREANGSEVGLRKESRNVAQRTSRLNFDELIKVESLTGTFRTKPSEKPQSLKIS